MWLLKLLGYGRWWGPSKKKSMPTPVDPVDPVDPVVVYPDVPVVVPPKPTIKEAFPNSVHIFCEANSANDNDFFAAATGRPYADIFFHAIRGTSGKGRTLRLIHPWYDPYKKSVDVGALIKQARAEGCVGISVDHEGWCVAAGPGWLRSLSTACRSSGMLLAIVPKFRLEHIVGAWKMSAEEAGQIISETCDLDLEWQYETTGFQYADKFDGDTVTCQQIGLIDGVGRYNDASTRCGWIKDMRARGVSVGIFLPKNADLAPACR